jgi:hypothetical protein
MSAHSTMLPIPLIFFSFHCQYMHVQMNTPRLVLVGNQNSIMMRHLCTCPEWYDIIYVFLDTILNASEWYAILFGTTVASIKGHTST